MLSLSNTDLAEVREVVEQGPARAGTGAHEILSEFLVRLPAPGPKYGIVVVMQLHPLNEVVN